MSPRHFEAAAFRVVQILFEGQYSGVLQPIERYIPLKKDLSNFEELISLFRDEWLRRTITDRAYADLIASGRYSSRSFVQAFDEDIERVGVAPAGGQTSGGKMVRILTRATLLRRIRSFGRPYYRRAIPQHARVRLRGLIDGARARLHRSEVGRKRIGEGF